MPHCNVSGTVSVLDLYHGQWTSRTAVINITSHYSLARAAIVVGLAWSGIVVAAKSLFVVARSPKKWLSPSVLGIVALTSFLPFVPLLSSFSLSLSLIPLSLLKDIFILEEGRWNPLLLLVYVLNLFLVVLFCLSFFLPVFHTPPPRKRAPKPLREARHLQNGFLKEKREELRDYFDCREDITKQK